MNYIVKDCPCLDSDRITCQDCTQDNPGTDACTNRNNCTIKKLIFEYGSISDFNQNMKEITKENEQLKNQLEFSRTHKTVLDAERIKYKKALEEIREYLEDIDYIAQFDGTPYDLSVEIKDKIKEVLDD